MCNKYGNTMLFYDTVEKNQTDEVIVDKPDYLLLSHSAVYLFYEVEAVKPSSISETDMS